jgi:uncharacterized membrane protein
MRSDKMGEEERTVAVAVLSAIIILASLLVYTLLTPVPQKPIVSIYLLNSEKKAGNLPELLVLGENNTFLLWVGVENFMGKIEYSSVLVKVTNGTGQVNPSPTDPDHSFERVLMDKETWEFPMTITMNQTGNHRLIFELWLFDEFENVFTYSRSYWLPTHSRHSTKEFQR